MRGGFGKIYRGFMRLFFFYMYKNEYIFYDSD